MITDPRILKIYLKLRVIGLAVFAAKRFFLQRSLFK